MKKAILVLGVIFVLGIINVNAQEQKVLREKVKPEQKRSERERTVSGVTLNVPMHCNACAEKVKKQLSFEKGVKNVIPNLEKQTVVVMFDNTLTDVDKLIASLSEINYKATVAPKPDKASKPMEHNKSCDSGKATKQAGCDKTKSQEAPQKTIQLEK